MTRKRKIDVYTNDTETSAYLYTTSKHATLKGALADFEDRRRVVFIAGAGLCTVRLGLRVCAEFQDTGARRYSRGLDARYSVRRHFSGCLGEPYAAFFCDRFIGRAENRQAAWEIAGEHRTEQLKRIEGAE